jgi:4-hydroxy-L-threonine phosphate dehydrogenase PdxA
MTKWIGIALGDVTGIGPEVALKALARSLGDSSVGYVLIGDAALITRLNVSLGLKLSVKRGFPNLDAPAGIYVHNSISAPVPQNLSTGSEYAARAAVEWLKEGRGAASLANWRGWLLRRSARKRLFGREKLVL